MKSIAKKYNKQIQHKSLPKRRDMIHSKSRLL